MNDQELITRYATAQDQQAFAELAQRHSPWVYSCAKRLLRNSAPADDVTQAVFILLARKSSKLQAKSHIAGWLIRATQYCAREAMRSHARRQKHEQEAAMQQQTNSPASDANWQEISPVLDEAVAKLSAKDRDAVLLHFYQGLSLSELASTLGTGEEAARKRVQRAVEKLRKILARKGISASATGLALVMTESVTQAAPAGVTEAAIAASSVGGAARSAGVIAKGAMIMMAWAKVKLVAALVTTLAIPGAVAINVSANAASGPVQTAPVDDGGSFLMQRILLCQERHTNEGTAESHLALVEAYDNYLERYRTHAKAGTFLQLRMELVGKIDLDALVAIYRDCEQKSSTQYNGAILGLANRLSDNERFTDALALYKEVDTEKIPSSRIVERHYGLGNAYRGNGMPAEALNEFLAVRQLDPTKRFADVPLLIEMITASGAIPRAWNGKTAAAGIEFEWRNGKVVQTLEQKMQSTSTNDKTSSPSQPRPASIAKSTAFSTNLLPILVATAIAALVAIAVVITVRSRRQAR